MFDLGLRVEVDGRNEKIGYEMRESQVKKIPYILVVGDKEMEANQVAVRKHGEQESSIMDVDAFIKEIQEKVATKA